MSIIRTLKATVAQVAIEWNVAANELRVFGPETDRNYVVFGNEAVYGLAAAGRRGQVIMRKRETLPDIARTQDVPGH